MNFIFDIDGTICFKGKPVSKKILDVLSGLQQQGHLVGFASARPCRDILPVLDERFHSSLLIGANGAMTYYKQKLVNIYEIPTQVLSELVGLMNRFQAAYLIDLPWDYHYHGRSDHPFLQKVDPDRLAKAAEADALERPAKFLVVECADSEALKSEVMKLDVNIHHHSDEEIVDITAHSVDKMHALRHFGMQGQDFICFGNDTNDLPMFRHAAHAVLIGEHKELSQYASEQIPLTDDIEEQIVSAIDRLAASVLTTL